MDGETPRKISVSEKTFGQRAQHGKDLSTHCHTISVYTPTNPLIDLADYDPFVDGLFVLNSNVESNLISLKKTRSDRTELYFGKKLGLIARARMIRDYVGSLPEGKQSVFYKALQKKIQELVNYKKPKKPKDPVVPATATEKNTISTSERSFGSMVTKGSEILEIIKKVPGYAPSNVDISTAKFELFIQSLYTSNTAVEQAYLTWDKSINDRFVAFEGTDGLKVRMRMIKEYIASQYGKQSNEYIEAVKIKY